MNKIKLINSKRDYLVIFTIIIIAFIIRVFCISEIHTPDSLLYTEKAFHFFETTYAVDDHRASRFGIIFPMALLMKMIGLNDFSIYGYGILCSLGTVLIIFYLGKSLFNSKVGLLSALLLAVNPASFFYSGYVYVSTIILFYSSLAVLLFYKGLTSRDHKTSIIYLSISGICAGIAYMTRSTGAYIIIVLFILSVYEIFFKKSSKKIALLSIPFLTFAIILIIEMSLYIYYYNDPFLRIKYITSGLIGLENFREYQLETNPYVTLTRIFYTYPAWYLSPKSPLFPIYWYTGISLIVYLFIRRWKKITVPIIWLLTLVILSGYFSLNMVNFQVNYILVTLAPTILICACGIVDIYEGWGKKVLAGIIILPILVSGTLNFANFQYNPGNRYSLDHRILDNLLISDIPENSVIYCDYRTVICLRHFNKYKSFPFRFKYVNDLSFSDSNSSEKKYFLVHWNRMDYIKRLGPWGNYPEKVLKKLPRYKRIFEINFVDPSRFSLVKEKNYKAELFSLN